MLLEINPINPQKRLISKTAKILEKGGIVAYPTDTIYGLGCNILNKKAIEKIYEIKQKKKNSPMSFICSGFSEISDYAKVSNYAYKIMKQLIPGPYTFILKASKLVPKIMQTKQKTVGIRVPDSRICTGIVESLGRPIISTSINTIGNNLLLSPSLVEEYLGKTVDAVIDGGPTKNMVSSIVSLINDKPKILRKGLGNTSFLEE